MESRSSTAKNLWLYRPRSQGKTTTTILLNECSDIKWFLKTLWYTHRSVSSSIIRESSSYSRWGYRDPHSDNTRVRDLGTQGPKGDAFIKSLPSGLSKPCATGSRKSIGAGGWGMEGWGRWRTTKGSNRVGPHLNSQQLWQRAWGLPGSAPDGALELKGNVIACTHP